MKTSGLKEKGKALNTVSRAIWKGIIHFGSVDVPVKLHTAVKEHQIQFHLLHKSDHIRLQQQMICAYEKMPVPSEEQIRGFKLEEGKYILVDPKELEQTEPDESRMVEVHEFVKADQIDPVFFDRVYYLEPDNPLKGYYALIDAMKEMELQGLCTWTMRKRSYLGALGVSDKIFRLITLRYTDEVISVNSLDLQDVPVTEKELKVGIDLITQLTGPFQPEQFQNEHQKKLQNLIDRKRHGGKIIILRPRRLKPTTPDKLLETLEASLKKVA